MNIKEAKVLITGGSSGIGKALAALLKEKGAKVTICARHAEKVDKTVEELKIHGLAADVSNEEDVDTLVAYAKEKMNGINVLINNAGIGMFAPLTECSVEDLTSVWDINVKGAFLMGRACAKIFVEQNSGNIVNIASTAGLKGFAGGTAYCSSKFALIGMTQCWRAELRKSNIRVMQVNPSEVVTNFGGGTEARENVDSKLKPSEIAHTIVSMLEMNDVGFITDATVWATNP